MYSLIKKKIGILGRENKGVGEEEERQYFMFMFI